MNSKTKMSEKKSVKVIKREERGKKKATSPRARRETVARPRLIWSRPSTSWVNEFQQKQREDASKAIENLMRARQQPNEA